MRLGATLWLLSIQYYVAQIVVALAWSNTNPYSWSQHTISDLANTVCGPYGQQLVCSPLHTTMNISFILLGFTMIGGSYFLFTSTRSSRLIASGYLCMALSGVGTILVGLFPENTVAPLHILGAGLAFVLGNMGMITIGASSHRVPKILRLATITAGVVGLVALVLFVLGFYGPLGVGGMERIVAYPQSIWMISVGAYVLIRRRRIT